VTDSVGIIGAGRLGQAMARTARRAGRDVVIANSRGPESLAVVASELGASSGTVGEAAAADVVGELATGGAMQQIHHPLAGVNLIRL
jgi:8-hydroxy-5-deazaflavin:NADPH oxidoreductase